MILRRYITIIKNQFQVFLRKLWKDYEYQQLLDSIKSYVPKYYKRSGIEHDAIRTRILRRQDRCSHLKGGPKLNANVHDYNVMHHIYIDGSTRIRCGNCGKKWTPESVDWKEALRMHDLSSNSITTSEIPLHAGAISDLKYGPGQKWTPELSKWL
jgi:hypothetical protein